MSREGLVGSNGTITIPAELRRKYRIKGGTRVQIESTAGGILIRPVQSKEAVTTPRKKLLPKAARIATKKEKRRGYGIYKGKLWAAADAFDPLTNEELKDWGIE